MAAPTDAEIWRAMSIERYGVDLATHWPPRARTLYLRNLWRLSALADAAARRRQMDGHVRIQRAVSGFWGELGPAPGEPLGVKIEHA